MITNADYYANGPEDDRYFDEWAKCVTCKGCGLICEECSKGPHDCECAADSDYPVPDKVSCTTCLGSGL